MNSYASTTLSPVAPQQRIEALDMVREFALFGGIFLMNIESRCVQMGDVAQGRRRIGAMRIAGQDPTAGLHSGRCNHPGVAALRLTPCVAN